VTRRVELLALLVGDALGLGAAAALFEAACARYGWMVSAATDPISTVALFVLGWLFLFAFSGLYGERYAGGRFDEIVTLAKVTAFGVLALFFSYYLGRLAPESVRPALVVYAAGIIGGVGGLRLMIRGVQKALILRGHGLHRAVVVGWSDRVETLYHDLAKYPAAGIELVGAVRLRHTQPVLVGTLAHSRLADEASETLAEGDALPIGTLELTASGAPETAIAELPGLIDRLGVRDVLIALGTDDHLYLDEVLRVCDGRPVSLKLVPDFYTAVGGMARTEHIYGLPLIEVLPEPIPAWEKRTKRILDACTAAAVLIAGLPLWLIIGALVRATSPGGAIYRQVRVGQGGRPFTMFKFRTMVDGAERETGPVWAGKGDARITPLGRSLRRLRLDEVPQLWNVLVGEMSLVGPRPERPHFVEMLTQEIPLYSRRHRVQPGITGLAQVKWRYDADLEDVRQKLKYDLFYIENMSLRTDAKILLQTVRTALMAKGQ
jgi:lipopolysaccharide/colanic/teichoic acid biosynthesis glycosyltransferase